MPEEQGVIIIGGGQAGLALGYFLREAGVPFVILESERELGASWRTRWDSLTLFTPAEHDRLPGMPLPLRAGSYPSKDEVADYLNLYAEEFALPVRTGSKVVALKRSSDRYRITTEHDEFTARQVVVATGPFQLPRLPSFSGSIDPEVRQLHTAEYRNPALLPPGRVLVVGGGNSGWQIAEELAATHEVVLAGRRLPRVPRRLLGKSLFWWLEAAGIMRVPARSALGRRMRDNDDIVIGDAPRAMLRSGRLRLAPYATGAEGDRIRFEDGTGIRVGSVVWATGYRSDFNWIDLPVFDESGMPVHRRGVTAEPGLYFLGLRWLHTTGSALLGWVGRDAKFLAEQILRADS